MSEHFDLAPFKSILDFRAVLGSLWMLEHFGKSSEVKSEEFCDLTVTVPVTRYLVSRNFRLKSCKAVLVTRWGKKTLLCFSLCKRKLT